MSNILVLNSSATAEGSVSRILVDEAVARLREIDSQATVTFRDLGTSPLPHLSTANLAGVRGTPQTDIELATQRLSDELLTELRAADIVVVGAPMHNFGVSTALRGWFDYVLRAGETFTYSDSGPKGLLSGKQVIVIETRGGIYEGEDKELDFQEPYVRLLFGFIGLTDVTFVHAEKLGFGPEAVEEAVLAAKRSIASITATVQSATV